ncbi:MAG: putative sugar nucleotidyl transferase [Gemmatimonadota bacterium]
MTLYLFDDAASDLWGPFALTRPIGELRFGDRLLRERLETFAGISARAALTRAWLAEFREAGAPPALPRDSELGDGDRLFLSSRFVPDAGSRLGSLAVDAPVLLLAGNAVAGLWVPAGREGPDGGWLLEPGPFPGAVERDVAGAVLPWPWSLIERNRDRLAADLASAGSGPRSLPEGVHLVGDGPLRIGAGVRIEPGVLLDTRGGGIRLDDGTEVLAGTRLAGPVHAGPACRLLGGPIGGLSAGPRCRLRGEIEDAIVLGFSNKAHDGFLGHACLGRWVNLGALTTNSDLKNNYGSVRVELASGEVDTGLLKLGCLLGDHVKTAIGTLLATGTLVGAGANLFGGDPPPRRVPAFAWGNGPGAPTFDRERFLGTAAIAMDRRGVTCDDGTRAWLGACWDAARDAGDAGG